MKPERVILAEDGAAGLLRRTAVSHIGLQVPNVEETADFYGRVLGMRVHATLADGGLRLGWGVGHHVLDLIRGEKRLDHYAFEVRDPGGLSGIRERLSAEGHRTATLDPSYLDESIGAADGISATDPDGHTIQFHSAVERQGEGLGSPTRRPVRYQHLTLGSTNLPSMAAFFTDVIGFRISDQLDDGKFVWLRSCKDHHSLAVVNGGEDAVLDHYSYDLAEWEDFKAWCDRLTDQGVDVAWGPGRHGPGNNLFIFFDDPAGNHVELSAEMEKFYDEHVTYVPRTWNPTSNTINLWGGQLPQWRRVGAKES